MKRCLIGYFVYYLWSKIDVFFCYSVYEVFQRNNSVHLLTIYLLNFEPIENSSTQRDVIFRFVNCYFKVILLRAWQ